MKKLDECVGVLDRVGNGLLNEEKMKMEVLLFDAPTVPPCGLL